MARIEDVIWCDGCGVEITWAPQVKGKRKYCCPDCLAERPCHCAERMELEDERRSNESTLSQVSDIHIS